LRGVLAGVKWVEPTMLGIRARLGQHLAEVMALVAGGFDPVLRPSRFADFQADGVLAAAKALGKKPRELAEEVAKLAEESELVKAAAASGPGFVNIWVSESALAESVARAAAGEQLPPSQPRSLRYVIDYSSPNVAKEMHVGHLRSTIIGDSLARMARLLGHEVIRQNHIGDWGTPFGMLIEYLEETGAAQLDLLRAGELDAFYKAARARFDASEEFRERARARVVRLQQGDPETRRLWQEIVAASEQYFEEVYHALGVELSSEDVRGESAYQDAVEEVVAELLEKGVAVVDQGAVCYFPSSGGPLIIRKADGGFGYAATDLAAIKYRIRELRADVVLYVVGLPQAHHLASCFEAARRAGWVPDGVELVHVGFGSVLGPDRKMLRSRSGESVRLMDLIEEGVKRAGEEMRRRGMAFDEEAARAVAVAAIKYADLSTEREQDYVFDWDRMLSFEGNTGPYLQYAHARICSIFAKGGIAAGAPVEDESLSIKEDAERRLALVIAQYPDALVEAFSTYHPHRLCAYLYGLASAFSAFYETCPVLAAPDERAMKTRLALSAATRRCLAEGLEALGIRPLERM
jgi:arginyl-tRNA synthetase